MRFRSLLPVSVAVGVAEQLWVATGYRFFPVAEPSALSAELEALAAAAELLGTILVASEGINLSVAGTAKGLDAFEAGLSSYCETLPLQRSPAGERRPFRRLRVRIREEIVTLGRSCSELDFEASNPVGPDRWDALLDDPDIPVVDVRNRYEVAVGRFDGAVEPETESFRDFPAWVEAHLDPEQLPAVAIYCTGGIRCTKAAAWMRSQGFRTVYELDGGVLAYLAARPEGASRWRGDCFVFDDRVGLAAGLKPGDLRLCRACGEPFSVAHGERDQADGQRLPEALPDLGGCGRADCPAVQDGALSKEQHA